jgi:hypothetical protein
VKGWRVVQIINRAESFLVRLVCALCGEKCRADDFWLAFPPGDVAEGRFVHRRCTSGRLESAFGVKRVVLLQGAEAMKRVAESLDEAADPALVKRPKAARARPLPGDAAPDIQRPVRKARLQ